MRTMLRVFVSYTASDKQIARNVADALIGAGFDVWIDQARLRPGDSIVCSVSAGLCETDIVLVLLSRASISSNWVAAEVNAALSSRLAGKGPVVVPVLLDDCNVPALLRDLVHIDLRVVDFSELPNQLHTIMNPFPSEVFAYSEFNIAKSFKGEWWIRSRDEILKSGLSHYYSLSVLDSMRSLNLLSALRAMRQLAIQRSRVFVVADHLWRNPDVRSLVYADYAAGICVSVASQSRIRRLFGQLPNWCVFGDVGVGTLRASRGVTRSFTFEFDNYIRQQAERRFLAVTRQAIPLDDPYIDDQFELRDFSG